MDFNEIRRIAITALFPDDMPLDRREARPNRALAQGLGAEAFLQ
jgi:hypothetical protein